MEDADPDRKRSAETFLVEEIGERSAGLIEEDSGAGRLAAFALIGGDQQIERSTPEFFKRHHLGGDLDEHAEQIQALLSGQGEPFTITWEGGSAELGPVVDREGKHRVLLTVRSNEASAKQRNSNALLDDPPEAGPAIIWLKDLHGRYLHVNARYAAHVGVPAEELIGRTEGELSHRESIDGLRLHRLGAPVDEPLQLEYIVPAFEHRPALVVLRFPVHNRQGEAVAVCGVAAPSGEAQVASGEAERLMAIESSSWLEPEAMRAKLLIEWGIRPVESVALPVAEELRLDRAEPVDVDPIAAEPPARPEAAEELGDLREALAAALRERDAALNQRTELSVQMEEARGELERELEATRDQIAELEHARQADDSKLRTQLDAARSELDATKATLSELRRENDADESELRTQIDAALSEANDARDALAKAEQARGAVEALLAEAESEKYDAARSTDELAQELASAKQQLADLLREREADESELQTQLEALRSEAEETKRALEEAERDRDEAREAQAELEQRTDAHRQRTEELEREVEHLRAELEHIQEDARPERTPEDARPERTPEDARPERTPEDAHPQPTQPEQLVGGSEGNPAGLGWSAAAQRELSIAISNASDWKSGLKSAVKLLGSNGGWDLVTAWLSDEHGALGCGATWTSDRNFSQFETLTWQTREAAIRSVLSRVLPARTATWVSGIAADSDEDARLNDAARLGIRTAVFVPIRDGSSPLGVLELLTRTDVEPDPEVSAALEGVAIQLGHFSHLLARAGRAHWHFGRF